jgi:hypothetical protein
MKIDLPGWDFHLGFSNGMMLKVFCDHVPGDPSLHGNWSLTTTDWALYVEVGSKIQSGTRQEAESFYPLRE